MDIPVYELEMDKGACLSDLLQVVIDNESEIREIWASPEQLDKETLILCNDIDIGLTGGLKTVLKNEDSLVILPLVHGG